ncbi:hypothetical protein Vretifemale_15010 [Volvox reticuliferus]|uniref:Uncharacterized protein n=2 Tax=Volvox reticuliferus TaxID=1737510 RepID=A0A8J4CUA3_9CHLO|nr:hypothetical protein Vretifemale_15010 [Volvox reticuliferus]
MTTRIQVRSLTGWSGMVEGDGDGETVADLRRKVTALNPQLSRFKIFCKGVAIADSTPLSLLAVGQGEFLTIVPIASTKDRAAARGSNVATAAAASGPPSRPSRASLPPAELATDFSTEQPVPYTSEGLITLLPGYESRPNRTPSKPRTASLPSTMPALPALPGLAAPLRPQPQTVEFHGHPWECAQMPASASRAPHCYGSGAVGHVEIATLTAMEEGLAPASTMEVKAVSTSAAAAESLAQEPVMVTVLAPGAPGAAAIAVGTCSRVGLSGRTVGLAGESACASEEGADGYRNLEPSQPAVEGERIHMMAGRVNVAGAATFAPQQDLFDELKSELLEAGTLCSIKAAGRQQEEPAEVATAAELAETTRAAAAAAKDATARSVPSVYEPVADSHRRHKKAKQADAPPPPRQQQSFESGAGELTRKEVLQDRIKSGPQSDRGRGCDCERAAHLSGGQQDDYGGGDGACISESHPSTKIRVRQRRRQQRSLDLEFVEGEKTKRGGGCSAPEVASGIAATGAGGGASAGEAIPSSSKEGGGAVSGMVGQRSRRPKVAFIPSGPLFQRAVADCVLPLPPSLERLQRIFRGVNTLYTFLLGQQVQMTWDNACEALQSQMPDLNITLDDLLLAAALVPDVLVTKMGTHGSVVSHATCRNQLHHHHGVEEASAAGGGGSGSLHKLMAAHGWRTDLAVHLDRVAEADSAAEGTVQCTSGGISVELIDPGRTSPLLYEEAPAAEAPAAEKQAAEKLAVETPGDCGGRRGGGNPDAEDGKRLTGDGDGGDKGAGTGSAEWVMESRQAKRRRRACLARQAAPVVLEDGRRLRFATNVITRRLAAFRRGLVSVLQHLHADFINRLVPAEHSSTRSGVSIAITTVDSTESRDSLHSSKTAPVAAAMAAKPSHATSMAAAAGPASTPTATPTPTATATTTSAVDPLPGTASWDPVVRRDWHPLFSALLRRDGITFQQLRSAAAELRSQREIRMQTTAGGSSSQRCPGTAPRPPTILKQYEPCLSSGTLTPVGLLRHLQELPWYKGQVVHVEVLPARPAAFARPTAPLASPVLRALGSMGILEGRLYTHQADAVDALLGYGSPSDYAQQPQNPHFPHHHAHYHEHHHGHQDHERQEVELQKQNHGVPLPGQAGVGPGPTGSFAASPMSRGRHVVVATSTASGKSLCYLVPLMQALSDDPDACALLMFPTKALAQDQLRAIRGLMEAAFGGPTGTVVPAVEVYDGDTSMSERPDIRQRAQVVLTNPDMLHATVLPGHRQFHRLLAKLALVVVDEGHVYEGVFGCHTALVLRRLRRLCNHVYGVAPRFVVTSATVANPLQLATRLLGVDETEIALLGPERDGSPCALRRFVLWNPPLTGRAVKAAEATATAEAARADSNMTRTEARAAVRITRNAERARQRQLLQEARAARVRASQLATERLAGGAAGAAAQEEMLQLAAAARPLQQLKEALFGNSPRKRHAAERRLAEVQAATVAAAAGASTAAAAAAIGGRGTALISKSVKIKEEPDETKLPVGPDVVAMAAQVRAALSAAVDMNGGGGIEGNRRQLPHLASFLPVASTTGNTVPDSTRSAAAAAAVDATAVAMAPTAQPSRPLILRTSGLIAAAAALGLPPANGGGGAATAAADSRVVRELLSQLPGPEWKEKHGAAGTPLEHRRDSPIVEMALLLAECVQHGLRTIAFCKSRKLCELVTAYTRETLLACAPGYEGRVKVYRAGYSPAERRAMEADIHSGRLLALAATNALELGVDVGGLDVTLHLGFPGSVASLRQQAGRAGRRQQESLSLVVGFDGPLDQHFMRHPEHLFGRPVESVQIDVYNPDVLQQHLLCAALEHPLLLDQDMPFFGSRMADIVTRLLDASLISRRPGAPFGSTSGGGNQEWGGVPAGGNGGGGGVWDAWLSVPLVYSGPKDNPASAICLRSIDPERFVIWDETTRMPLEEIEANMAFYEVYDGAVYMFQGRPYLCRQLNLSERVAIVRPADVKYYTKVKDYTDVYVTGGHVAYPAPTPALHRVMETQGSACGPGLKSPRRIAAGVTAPVTTISETREPVASANASEAAPMTGAATATGGAATPNFGTAVASVSATTASCESALVVVRYLGFHRVWQGSNRVFDTVDLFLPDVIYETQAAYVRVPPSARRECSARNLSFREGCHAANHALLNVVPLFLIANARDLGTECDNPYDARYRVERLLVYDKHRGGMGLSVAAAPLFPALLERAHRLVSECSCHYAKGCPQCVQHLECRNYNAVLNKAAAEVVLRHVLEQERAHAEVVVTRLRQGSRGAEMPEGTEDEEKGVLDSGCNI